MASKIAKMDGTRPPRKTAATNGTRRGSTARKIASAKKPRRPDPRYWKRALERNLMLEGYSRAEAREIVVDFAAS
jgi:hypothetical protein